MPTIPVINDPHFQAFCDFLRSAPVQPAKGLPQSGYVDHHQVLNVPVVQHPGFNIGSCWYNCLELQISKGGEVIYGWSLWQDQNVFIAQHHAVWLNDNGQYVDPTPNEGLTNTALFMPDNRAPFDIIGLRAYPNLEWVNNNNHKWLVGPLVKDLFFITKLTPTPVQATRIKAIQQALGV
jgi:hypothetical protein